MPTDKNDQIRVITFYLPQFHPTRQNDEWWGKGFTEWTNVAKARPQFPGHYQPHRPADLGYYDLRVPEVRQQQADLAREYNVHGFCYYHYWFHGTRMLERIVDDIVASGQPDFPFSLCWANESWTKTWVGGDTDILIEQTYSDEDDLAHIRYLIPIFQDKRYIRVNGRPLFVIYETSIIQSRIARTLEIWNAELEKVGIPGLYLCSMRTQPLTGFEAAINFFPNFRIAPVGFWEKLADVFRKRRFKSFRHALLSYERLVDHIISTGRPAYRMYQCPVPAWDNSPRRAEKGALILTGSNPDQFRKWMDFAIRETLDQFEGEERLVFVNAWNEWAEGAHLEPDEKWGMGFLEAISDSVTKNQK